MAVALEIGVLYLLLEFLTHTFCIVVSFAAAGTVSPRLLKPLFDHFNYLGVFVQSDLHINLPSLNQFLAKAVQSSNIL